MIKLKDHQKKPVEFIKNNFGLILFHSTGSGKTITSLMAVNQFNNDVIIIGPKSSKKAFEDEIHKLNLRKGKFSFFTYQKMKNIINDKIDYLANKCVIIDEAHHLRTETRDNLFIINGLLIAFRVMLLTATPIINYLNDISPLVNIVKKKDVFPSNRSMFNFFYFDENDLKILNKNILQEKLLNCISYYEKKNDENFPKSTTFIKKVVMTKEQLDEYGKYILKIIYKDELPRNSNLIDLFNVELDFLNKRNKNSFLNATRQISNTVDGDIKSKKMEQVIKIIIEGPFPVVVYSNFLKNGIYPIAKLLDGYDIPYKIISGSSSNDKIKLTINSYNKRLFKVLLISSAGSESLDLKNTRQIHILEPHWNEAKIKQVIGRAIRYKSHNELPIKERHVSVYRWISIFPEIYSNLSADEYLTKISKKKDEIFRRFKNIIIESSIENNKINIDLKLNNIKMPKNKYYDNYMILKKKYLDTKYHLLN